MAASSRLQRSLSESKVNGWLFEHILEVGGGQEKVGTKGTAAVCFEAFLGTMLAALRHPFFFFFAVVYIKLSYCWSGHIINGSFWTHKPHEVLYIHAGMLSTSCALRD